MKKTIVIFFMILVFTLVGCSAAAPEGEVIEQEEPGSMGVPNPLSEATLESMREETGSDLILPESLLEELTVTRINTEPATYSLDYNYQGAAYQFRLQKSHEMSDLSGMYFNWTTVVANHDPSYEISLTEEGQGICLWQDAEFTYSISMSEQASETLLREMYQLLMG